MDNSGGGLVLPAEGVAELKNLAIQQGPDLDTKYMNANLNGEASSKPSWKVRVTFKNTKGKRWRLPDLFPTDKSTYNRQ